MNATQHKVGFFWVLIVFIVMISVAYASHASAKSVKQYNQEQDLAKEQQRLDFPVLEHWPAGNYDDAVWVEPRQSLSPVGLPVDLDTPKYKISLDSSMPETRLNDYDRIDKTVPKIELFGWD